METINIFETEKKNYKQGVKESFPVTGMIPTQFKKSVDKNPKSLDGI